MPLSSLPTPTRASTTSVKRPDGPDGQISSHPRTPDTPHTLNGRHTWRTSNKARAWTTIFVHSVVDLFSFIAIPLLAVLQSKLNLDSHQPATLITIGALSSGLVQPVVALVSDRRDTRAVGTIGFGVAVIGVSLIGYTNTFWQLAVLQAIAAAGIGAFHPVAAAAVGQLTQPRRSLGLAWFYAAGMIGGVCGNLFAPAWVRHFSAIDGSTAVDISAGLRSLAWLIPPGLIFVALLATSIHGTPHRRSDAHARHQARDGLVKRAAWTALFVLYLANVLKFGIDTSLVALVKAWSDGLAAGVGSGAAGGGLDLTAAGSLSAASISGPLQAAKQIGMGSGGLALGFFLSRRHERLALVVLPLFGAVCLLALPHSYRWAAMLGLPGFGSALSLLVCALAGAGYGASVPLTIAMAQRLLPHRTSLASGILLGGAWGVGSIGARLAQGLAERFGLEWAFAATAITSVIAAMLALPLGKLMSSAIEDEAG